MIHGIYGFIYSQTAGRRGLRSLAAASRPTPLRSTRARGRLFRGGAAALQGGATSAGNGSVDALDSRREEPVTVPQRGIQKGASDRTITPKSL